ncbi:hypothetical protein IAT38_001770 [Cryptococcus sp. DSM 104549]
MSTKQPLHKLPLPSSTLQASLPRLPLADKPSSQRRSTTFKPSTEGVWARIEPLWDAWPIRLTKEEALEMGVDVEKGQQVDVEDVLRRWDAVDPAPFQGEEKADGNGLEVKSSKHRLKIEPVLLGVSPRALQETLPHLDVGDALEICNSGLDSDATATNTARESFIDLLSGKRVISSKEYGPWATRYCGHQFGVWAGQLGDGRAISILETESEGGGRQEIQLKGAGRTPFSRSADGLAVLRSGVREFLGCEAVAALGIPTTRSLALLTTPLPALPVIRENGPEPSSLFCRLSPSFIRIGHFEALNPSEDVRGARQIFLGGSGWMDDQADGETEDGNLEGLRDLSVWVKDEIMGIGREGEGEGWKKWVQEVVRKNAEMVAGWQVYGYMNGVINTDNVTLIGATIDYGPYAFMDVFDENHICNHSDPSGLYSYRNQPSRILFALDKFVNAVAPLVGYASLNGSVPKGFREGANKEDIEEWADKGIEVLDGWDKTFWDIERDAEQAGWSKRFGLRTTQQHDPRDIKFDFLSFLRLHALDFHTAFRRLAYLSPSLARDDPAYLKDFTSKFVRAGIKEGQAADAVGLAETDLGKWLGVYAERVRADEEVAAWGGGEEWETTRREEMLATNPRFVLRQWVLEEVIGKMEDALMRVYKTTGAEVEVDAAEENEGVKDARKELAKVLKMSSAPFEPYGETEDACSLPEEAEERRLCGIGKKEMLGFQCSCSS